VKYDDNVIYNTYLNQDDNTIADDYWSENEEELEDMDMDMEDSIS
jgi:hypothetical protein